MTTITLKMHVHARRSDYDGSISWYLYSTPCMQEYGYVQLFEHDVSFEIPDDFDMTPAEIALLKEAKKAVQAACQKKLDEIDEKIQKLLCIEHKPEEVKS